MASLGRRWFPPALLLAGTLAWVAPAAGLDLFALWRRPEIPLRLEAGEWSEYKRTTSAGGRRTEDLLRIQCVAAPLAASSAAPAWTLEVLPLVETAGRSRQPVAGEGLRIRLSAAFLARAGSLLDAVVSVERWQQGQATLLTAGEWREDPLVADILGGEFQPDSVERQEPTVRVIGGRELLCEQHAFAASDTQTVDLPAGKLMQVTVQDVTTATSAELPFLGLAFMSERVAATSTLDPPSRRFSPPPPQLQTDSLECIGFGAGARAVLDTAPGAID